MNKNIVVSKISALVFHKWVNNVETLNRKK
jgi:hypothetical protein